MDAEPHRLGRKRALTDLRRSNCLVEDEGRHKDILIIDLHFITCCAGDVSPVEGNVSAGRLGAGKVLPPPVVTVKVALRLTELYVAVITAVEVVVTDLFVNLTDGKSLPTTAINFK
ncbi:MAG TPA: hypothetical protein VGI60_03910 [Chthoniobacterales bacterium]